MDSLYASRLARAVLELDHDERFVGDPALILRARSAALPAVPRERSIAEPNYITDLGLRKSSEPSLFVSEHLALNPALAVIATRSGDSEAIGNLVGRWRRDELAERQLGAALDAVVCFLGDWSAAFQLVSGIDGTGKMPEGYACSLYMGAVLGIHGSMRAGAYLARAASGAPDEPTSFMAELRIAAWEIKRLRNLRGGLDRLDELIKKAESWRHGCLISEGDYCVLVAVASNLKALAEFQRGAGGKALATVQDALMTSQNDDLVTVDSDQADRYRCQMRINVAQMLLMHEQVSQALGVLEENVHVAQLRHPFSLAEAYAVFAYFSYLAGNHAEAVHAGVEAESLVMRHGAPEHLRLVRRLLASCLHHLGRDGAAREVLAKAARDPLGLEEPLKESSQYVEQRMDRVLRDGPGLSTWRLRRDPVAP